jgi:hypothetical protein
VQRNRCEDERTQQTAPRGHAFQVLSFDMPANPLTPSLVWGEAPPPSGVALQKSSGRHFTADDRLLILMATE